MKKENDESIKTDIHRESSKEFLFDPFAAAYYSRFSDYVPGQHSIQTLLSKMSLESAAEEIS